MRARRPALQARSNEDRPQIRRMLMRAVIVLLAVVVLGTIVAVVLGANPLFAAPLAGLAAPPTILIVRFYFREDAE